MIAGVDGCAGGWLVALADGAPRWPPTLRLCRDFPAVLATTAACEVVVVDMPIGLADGPGGRPCDLAAKRVLGPAAARVFLAPPRAALSAATPRQFQARYRRERGQGAAVPLWGIVPKLIEVDTAMRPALQKRIKEFHPELAWARLAGRVLTSKHTRLGLTERAALLAAWTADVGAGPRDLGLREVRQDDVLDALVGLPVAADIVAGRGRRLPELEPPRDARGLAMEIWY